MRIAAPNAENAEFKVLTFVLTAKIAIFREIQAALGWIVGRSGGFAGEAMIARATS
jgi:hypothetical protein